VEGNTLSIELEMGRILKDLVAEWKPKICVEIGTGNGYSTSWILMGSNGSKVYTVDNTDRSPYFWDKIGLDKKPIVSRGTIQEVVKDLPNKIDFIFHDAGHKAHFVIPDLEILEPKMAKRCLITIHDTNYSRQMGDDMRNYFENKKGWKYAEIIRGCGLGMATKGK